MFHTGSRGFGHGLATHYFERAQDELGLQARADGPRLLHAALAALALVPQRGGGGRQLRDREPPDDRPGGGRARSRRRSAPEPELVYEISHNLVQEETHPDLFDQPVWVHRKGATRALPAGHPMLAGTRWETTGHPVLIPGSMGDFSYVLRPLPGRGARRCTP